MGKMYEVLKDLPGEAGSPEKELFLENFQKKRSESGKISYSGVFEVADRESKF